MCGICGVNGRCDLRVITEMTRTMIHRGPDDEGFHLSDGIALGVRRLSIIDLDGGAQPIGNEDGTVIVVMNGEIYNHAELRRQLEQRGHRFRTRADTEVLPHLYEEYGVEGVHLLRGMFAFALWDEPRRRLVLVRDRLGIKPCFYTHAGGDLVFASEPKALLKHPAVTSDVDSDGIDLFLTFGYVPGPETLFRGIRKLPPGHLLVGEHGQTHIRRYWAPVVGNAEPGIRLEEASEEFLRIFDEAVRLHLVSDVPVGALLSGGIDSSSVVGAMRRAGRGPVRTFTVGYDTPGMLDERSEARSVARHFGTDHHELVVNADLSTLLPEMVRQFDDPVADPAALPTYLICQFARRSVPVVLTGEGSDELLAGYPRYAWFQVAKRLQRIAPAPLRAVTASALSKLAPMPPRYRKAATDLLSERDDVSRHLTWIGALSPELKSDVLAPEFRASLGSAPRSKIAAWLERRDSDGDVVNRLLALDMQTWLVDDVLAKMDRMSMAASVEARVPFLDHRLVEYVTGLPRMLKLRGLRGKRLLRHAMHDVLPPVSRERRKTAFGAPIGYWLRHPLREMLSDTLLAPRVRQRGWLNAARLEAMIRAHDAGKSEYGRPLWNLLCLELWARTFLDSPVGSA